MTITELFDSLHRERTEFMNVRLAAMKDRETPEEGEPVSDHTFDEVLEGFCFMCQTPIQDNNSCECIDWLEVAASCDPVRRWCDE